MALDPQPFIDLGYDAIVAPEDENVLYINSLDFNRRVTADTYDKTLTQAGEHRTNRNQLKQARNTFKDNYDNWSTMTNAQKDAANRNAQRALAHLIGDVIQESN